MRTSLIAAGSLALALTLSACGGETTTTGTATPGETFQDAASLVSAATESTSEQKSANFTMEMNMGPVTATGDGQGLFDGANTKMAMTYSMDMSAMGQGTMEMEMRLLDNMMYMKMPSGMPGADSAKPWMKVDLAQMSKESGMDFGQMMEQSDPAKTLELLRDAGEITGTEETELDGTAVTKYTMDVDFHKFMAQYGESMGQMPDMSGVKMDAMPVELWINEDNLPVQFTMDMGELMRQAVKAEGEEMPPGMNFDDAGMTMKYSDWGTPVSIAAPPESEVGEGNFPGGN